VFPAFKPYFDGMENMRVMIVDDAEEVRKDLSTLLSLTANIEIVGEARDGREAIQKARTLHPDVIVMDLEMPSCSGYEAASLIKTAWPSCRIIALTIHDDETARLQAARAGMDAFIVKSAKVESLVDEIMQGGH
jgi:DNA-binding NarL/FixJ family response regulator